jgi:hypothetical protein
MVPLIPIAISLVQEFAPQIIGLFKGKQAEDVAQKVVDVAKTVTGAQTPEQAMGMLRENNELAQAFQRAMIEAQVELEKIAAGAAAEVNATMRAEAASEHWPSYSWRPAIGFAVAIDLVGAAVVTLAAYGGVMFFGVKTEVLGHLPAMIGSLSALVAVASPILGIASWFRGKMQADPTIPTINRG